MVSWVDQAFMEEKQGKVDLDYTALMWEWAGEHWNMGICGFNTLTHSL